eukprot:3989-Heterococcus_DN1.PRE.1
MTNGQTLRPAGHLMLSMCCAACTGNARKNHPGSVLAVGCNGCVQIALAARMKTKDRSVEADAAVSMDHPPPAGIPEREQVNWLINQKFVRQEYGECLLLIEQQLRARKGMCEYSLYMKALLLRMEGRIPESLALFQAATCLNPTNAANLKQ